MSVVVEFVHLACRRVGNSTVALVRATSTISDTAATKEANDAPPTPFSQVFVTITKQEPIELKLAALQWQGLQS
jgi:hypothetical protein